ncbi:oxoglutarate/iron-dependent dioxygenase [Artemisia annua]|uniref:Oxoglutarate/iron-dependent dioxygenase n=1 Tax=Artemisia annua TaxID=35608 RepID=A0A2U1NA39_ARTAN|nr:oxoglutarate/iron-dependent dioxygenase [Artemisia annua]
MGANSINGDTSIPVIDLQDFPNQSSKLLAACEEWGCFRLLNFNEILPKTLMLEMQAVARSLCDLPEEIKRRNIDHEVPEDGYAAPSPKYPLYEAIGMQDLTSTRGVDLFCSQLDAAPQQRETIKKYAEAIDGIAREIVKKMGESLGVKSENLKFENWKCKSRINKYQFTPQSFGSLGAPVHTDSGILTLVHDDEEGVGGLEAMSPSGDFVPFDPWPGTLSILIADMATVWSNGRFRNVKHKIVSKDGKSRVSVTSFVTGLAEILEPLPELVDDHHPRLFLPIDTEGYRKLRYSKNLHDGEALALLQPDHIQT